jgi:hypothetical protein
MLVRGHLAVCATQGASGSQRRGLVRWLVLKIR